MQPIYMFLLIFCNENYVSVATAIILASSAAQVDMETFKGKEIRQCMSVAAGVEALVSCSY